MWRYWIMVLSLFNILSCKKVPEITLESSAPSINRNRVESNFHGFSIDHPRQWNVQQNDQTGVPFLFNKISRNGRQVEQIRVLVKETDSSSLAAFCTLEQEGLQNEERIGKLLNTATGKSYQGVEFCAFLYEDTSEKNYNLVYAYVYQGKGFVIISSCPISQYGTRDKYLFEEISRSIRFK